MEFNDRYNFDTTSDLLAEGPHARVYKAFDKLLQRDICLKVFSKDFATGSPVIQQLNRAGIFFHPNICAFYDLIEVSTINVFGEKEMQAIGIFEYNNCGTITTFLKNNSEPELIKKLLKDVLKGLSYLHLLENPHLDLKPNNILVKKQVTAPIAKITDFLNLVNIKANNAYSENTCSGLAYKAPEHFSGNQNALDYRADIWSLGTIVFEIITGTSLFYQKDDTTEKTIKNILISDFDSKLADLPEPFKTFVSKCLIRDVGLRNVSLEELSTILDKAAENNQSYLIGTEIPISEKEKKAAIPTTLIRENRAEQKVQNIEGATTPENKIETSTVPELLVFAKTPERAVDSRISNNKKLATTRIVKILTTLLLLTAFIFCFGIGTYYYLNSSQELATIQESTMKSSKPTEQITPHDTISENEEVQIDSVQNELTDTLQSTIPETSEPLILEETSTPKTTPKVTTKIKRELTLPKLPDFGTLYIAKSYNFNLSILSDDEYTLWADHATVTEIGHNNFNLIPYTDGSIDILVLDKKSRTKITEKTYLVKAKPILTATLGDDINGGYASAQEIISKLSMQVKADGKPIKVKSFRLTCASGTCSVTESQGGFLNSSMIQFLRKTKAGEKIRFDNIKAIDQEGEEYPVKDFSVTLTDSFIH